MKNVLLVEACGGAIGGVDSVLLALTQGTRDLGRGYKFFLAMPPGNPNADRHRASGVVVYELEHLSCFSKSRSWATALSTLANIPKAYGSLRRIAVDHQIELVHSHKINSFLGDLVARALGKRSIHTYHEVNTGHLWIYQFFNFVIEHLADAIVILCDASGEFVPGDWRTHRKVHKIYNGVDVRHFSPSPPGSGDLRSELGLRQESRVVVAVSRMDRTKGLEYYIDAAQKVLATAPEVEFLMVGEIAYDEPGFARYKEELFRLVREKGISGSFHFTGRRRDVKHIYALADVFVLPSVFDVLPTTVLEAMAMEVPVVATRVGGVAEEVLDGETGYLVPPRDSSALAEKIIEVLDNPIRSHEMGRSGRMRVLELFTRERYVEQTLALYESVLPSGGLS
jgi:glycosyltransferase involved in cell wall biosynthesis